MTDLESFVNALPKVELHVHLVGSASADTVLELARQHPDSPVPRTADGLRDFYEFRDFPHFAKVYQTVSSLVRDPLDVATLVLGAGRDLAAQRVRYVELTVTPYTFVSAGMPMAAVTEALDIAARQVGEEQGVRVGYIFDIASELGAEAAWATLDHALKHPPQRLVGFGLAGIEQAREPHRDAFRAAFRSAVEAGLHSVPHAGEMAGAEVIWEAVRELGAERIGHGINCLADPDLVAYLREHQIPLEVCPTSNVRTRQVPDLAAHPLPRLLEEGLYVTLNSDDPPMFGTTLNGEYLAVASTFNLGPRELADLAVNAVNASFLSPAEKAMLTSEIRTTPPNA
jgi:aminodeoxyfutalosine deaminase